MIALKFNENDIARASDEWGCNCGPSALAAILGVTLDEIRPIVEQVGFAERGYMNVTMMKEAIAIVGGKILGMHIKQNPEARHRFFASHGLVRIQWGGPWIIDGKPARWAATATHWVASEYRDGKIPSHIVFDVNGGLSSYDRWCDEIVPAITASIKRCDGSWYPTHSWEIKPS